MPLKETKYEFWISKYEHDTTKIYMFYLQKHSSELIYARGKLIQTANICLPSTKCCFSKTDLVYQLYIHRRGL